MKKPLVSTRQVHIWGWRYFFFVGKNTSEIIIFSCLNVILFTRSVHKNQSRFECPPMSILTFGLILWTDAAKKTLKLGYSLVLDTSVIMLKYYFSRVKITIPPPISNFFVRMFGFEENMFFFHGFTLGCPRLWQIRTVS